MEKLTNAVNLAERLSRKQCERFEQLAYYQAGKIVVQTLLPQHPPVALIVLNFFGITSSTSADTYIPIDNPLHSQCCSSLETRLVGLYGGKAASLLLEYQYGVKSNYYHQSTNLFSRSKQKTTRDLTQPRLFPYAACCVNQSYGNTGSSIDTNTTIKTNACIATPKGSGTATKEDTGGTFISSGLRNRVAMRRKDAINWYTSSKKRIQTKKSSKRSAEKGQNFQTPDNLARLVQQEKAIAFRSKHAAKISSAKRGNNPFQSNIGMNESQTAHFLATVMVNNWDLYCFFPIRDSAHYSNWQNSRNKVAEPALHTTSLPSSMHHKAPQMMHGVQKKKRYGNAGSIGTLYKHIRRFTFSNLSVGNPFFESYLNFFFFLSRKESAIFSTKRAASQESTAFLRTKASNSFSSLTQQTERITLITNTGIQTGTNGQTLDGLINEIDEKWLRFAISQGRNSLKLCPNNIISSNNARVSVENIGTGKQEFSLWITFFQLVNLLQHSTVQRNRFDPNWFRLYLPDIEATEFLKNVANSYFSLGLQAAIRPSVQELTRLMYFNTTNVRIVCKNESNTTSTCLAYNNTASKFNFKTKTLAFIQKLFFCYGHNNLSIGMGLLRSMAKRRDHLNIRNLSITFASLLNNHFFEKDKQISEQLSYPTISTVLWGFSKPWKINRFVNIGLSDLNRTACLPFFQPLLSSACTTTVSSYHKIGLPSINSKAANESMYAIELQLLQENALCGMQRHLFCPKGGVQDASYTFCQSRRGKEVFKNEQAFFQFAKSHNTEELIYQKEHLLILRKSCNNVFAPLNSKGLPTQINSHLQCSTNEASLSIFESLHPSYAFKECKEDALCIMHYAKPNFFAFIPKVAQQSKKLHKVLGKQEDANRTSLASISTLSMVASSAIGMQRDSKQRLATIPTIGMQPFQWNRFGKIKSWDKKTNLFLSTWSDNNDKISQKRNNEMEKLGTPSSVQLGGKSKKMLVEKQVLPIKGVPKAFILNASFIKKDFISQDLVNNCLAQAFLLINRNRQVVDYFADYLLRFQVLRQHQILYLFSAAVLNCKK